MNARLTFVCLASTLLACGNSHELGDAVDGGVPLDAFAGEDAPLREDVGPRRDTGSDAGADAGTASCSADLTARDGNSCFCQGAFALGDGDLAYRSSFELEVHDISGDSVELVHTTPEIRPGSEGALVVANGHLFSGGGGMEVFDLDNPRRPRSVAVVDFEGGGQVTDFAVIGSTIWVGVDRSETAVLYGYDVRDAARPREVASMPLDGQPGSVLAMDDGRLVVVQARRFGEEGPDTALVVDVSGRMPSVAFVLELAGSRVLRRRGAVEGSTLVVAGSAPMLQVFDLGARRRVASLEAPDESGFGLGIALSDGIALVSGGQVHVADVRVPSEPRWIGRLGATGDVHRVQRRGDSVFIGTGGYLGRIPFESLGRSSAISLPAAPRGCSTEGSCSTEAPAPSHATAAVACG